MNALETQPSPVGTRGTGMYHVTPRQARQVASVHVHLSIVYKEILLTP